MSKILLYNITDPEKNMKIRLAAYRLGLRCMEVSKSDYAHPLGYLLGEAGYAPAAEAAEAFSDEMLVMETLCSPLLDALRAEGAPVALKAVVTDHNRAWSSARLHAELLQEHEALQRLRPNRPANRHPHKKKK